MWIIDFLPNFIIHLILLAGILGMLVSFVIANNPFLIAYKTVIQLVSILAIIFGIYFEGGIANEDKWQSRVNELEVKLAKVEADSAKENELRSASLAKKEKVLDKRQSELNQYVNSQIVKYNNQCIIPTEFIQTLNRAAENAK